jgi:hypothetical protein
VGTVVDAEPEANLIEEEEEVSSSAPKKVQIDEVEPKRPLFPWRAPVAKMLVDTAIA